MKPLKLLLLVLIYSIKSYCQNWACSSTPKCELTVYDKSDYSHNMVNYKFEVTNTKTHAYYYCSFSKEGGQSVVVWFPGDDNKQFLDSKGSMAYIGMDGGTFSWKCSANNKVFVTGTFVLGANNKDLKFPGYK